MLYRKKPSKLRKNDDGNNDETLFGAPISFRPTDSTSDEWAHGQAILDTGSTMELWLPRKTYTEMGGKPQGQRSSIVVDGSEVKSDTGRVTLKIGDKEFDDIECGLTDDNFAILGLPLLSHFDISIKNGQAYLKPKE